jgi:capsular polysaccharide export protein
MNDLHVVFLQGLPSPFFTRVARKLTDLGCRTTGFNLCVGDQLFWRGPNTVNYRGKLADWSQFIADFYDQHAVTDIVLLGEQRSYHQHAIKLAQARGIRVTVTDFGYLRPDWMAFERDGMGGDSHFPKDPQAILALAANAPKADLSQRYADSFWTMAWGDMLYHLANFFYFWLFPYYRRPYKRNHPLVHYFSIGRRLLFAQRGHRYAEYRLAELRADNTRYFLFPLQLENDFQIVSYSPFDSLEEAICLVLQSFSAHAETDTRLLIKVHPLDPGLKSWKKIIYRWANELRIAERIDYFDGGNLDDIIRASQGVITVNSTVGIRAIQLDCPVMTLGDAIYDVDGLAFQGSVDQFWTSAQKPVSALADAFIHAVCHTIQIRGTFYSEPGLGAAVDEAVARIYGAKATYCTDATKVMIDHPLYFT